MKLIGIHGKKRSGKDTLCAYLQGYIPHSHRAAFADELKLEVSVACGVSIDYIEEHKDNFRLILQGWGTDFRRELFGTNYWINRMEEKLSTINKLFDVCIVPDVRFENEYSFIKSQGGIMIKIIRNIPSLDNHPSERSFDAKFDLVVDNNGELSNLKQIAEQIVLQHKLV